MRLFVEVRGPPKSFLYAAAPCCRSLTRRPGAKSDITALEGQPAAFSSSSDCPPPPTLPSRRQRSHSLLREPVLNRFIIWIFVCLNMKVIHPSIFLAIIGSSRVRFAVGEDKPACGEAYACTNGNTVGPVVDADSCQEACESCEGAMRGLRATSRSGRRLRRRIRLPDRPGWRSLRCCSFASPADGGVFPGYDNGHSID